MSEVVTTNSDVLSQEQVMDLNAMIRDETDPRLIKGFKLAIELYVEAEEKEEGAGLALLEAIRDTAKKLDEFKQARG